jgi:hypothetical protein
MSNIQLQYTLLTHSDPIIRTILKMKLKLNYIIIFLTFKVIILGGADFESRYKELPKSDDDYTIITHLSQQIGGSYYGTPISHLFYNIIRSFSRINNDMKWYSLVGVTGILLEYMTD